MEYKKVTHNQRFTDDGTLNSDLRNGDWLNLLVDDMTLGDLRLSISDTYFLDDDIVSRLVFKYHIPGKDGKKSTVKYIVAEDECLPSAERLQNRHTLMVRYLGKTKSQDGDKRMVDVSCDYEYIDKVMPQVGQAIRDTYHWVPREHPIFLYLDNAGGHGTQEIVDKYVKYLKDDFNVVCVHQLPRSP